MTIPWNGLPDQPERSGWHWIAAQFRPNEWHLRKWIAEVQIWDGVFGIKAENAAHIWVYGCPALNPSELAQMRKDERERAAKVAQEISVHYYALGDTAENDVDVVAFEERMFAADECAVAIRSLPDEEGIKS